MMEPSNPPFPVPPKQPRKKLHISIVWKLFGSVLLCLVVLILFYWVLSNFALVSYYRNAKQTALEKAFIQVEATYNGSGGEMDALVSGLLDEQNIRTAILATYSEYPFGYLYTRGWPERTTEDEAFIRSALSESLSYDPGTYHIEATTDSRTNSQFYSLVGRLSNGYQVLMRTPVAAIEESVDITNSFLLFAGAAALMVSLGFSLIIARSFTSPIRELSRVAGSLAALHFDDRYHGGSGDELDDLGNSINSMADSLERTISNIKTANIQLQKDVTQKTQQNEARKSFISNVSHELKTPIALIQTYAEGLKEGMAEDPESRDYYCSVIEDEAQKMSELIKKMTALMQLEAGSEQLVIERVDITELAENLLHKNQMQAEQRHVHLLSFFAGNVYVWADRYLIENVLTNYLSNAFHHVPDGGVIEMHIQPSEMGRIRISVYNSGSHIPTDDLSHIWESFYKVDKARTRSYGGTGIGLSVVAAIMKAHNMPYGVYNRQGASGTGVEFFIELEAAEQKPIQ